MRQYRHCERSEAIQLSGKVWIASSPSLLAMTIRLDWTALDAASDQAAASLIERSSPGRDCDWWKNIGR
jgi:hypothetical protein